MALNFMAVCRRLKLPPRPWMMANPFKIYEFEEVSSRLGLQETHQLLDLGCGKGHWTIELARQCKRAVGVDTSAGQIAVAEAYSERFSGNVEFLCMPIEKAGLLDDTFDRAVSFCVLEHIPDLNSVLDEIYRVLKPGGQFVATVDSLGTIRDELRAVHREEHHVHEYFTVETIQEKMREVGFDVLHVRPLMTGEHARKQFEQRIEGSSYKLGLFERTKVAQTFREEDQNGGDAGIMILIHVEKPALA
jgi:SAM-dependent methyltransferase